MHSRPLIPSYPGKHQESADLLCEQSRPRSDYAVHKLVQVHAARTHTLHKCIKFTFTLVTFSFLTVIYLKRHVLCMAKTTTCLIRERRGGRSAHRTISTNNKLRHPLYKAPLKKRHPWDAAGFLSLVRSCEKHRSGSGCAMHRLFQSTLVAEMRRKCTNLFWYHNITWKAPTAPHECVGRGPALYYIRRQAWVSV